MKINWFASLTVGALLLLASALQVQAGTSISTTVTLTATSGTVAMSWKKLVDDQTGATKLRIAQIATTSTAAGGLKVTIPAMTGRLVRVVVVPYTGTLQPSDQFDLVCTNLTADDVFASQGANISNSLGKSFWTAVSDSGSAKQPLCTSGSYQLLGINIGDKKRFYLYLFFE